VHLLEVKAGIKGYGVLLHGGDSLLLLGLFCPLLPLLLPLLLLLLL
jgi:hypothetical protein